MDDLETIAASEVLPEKDLVRAALRLLGMGVADLLADLNFDQGDLEPKVARSTVYRWLSGENPPGPVLRCYLRERLLQKYRAILALSPADAGTVTLRALVELLTARPSTGHLPELRDLLNPTESAVMRGSA